MTKLTASYIASVHPYEFKNKFGLTVLHNFNNTKITMKLYTPYVNTKYIPSTHMVLKTHLPSILHATCFNEQKLPFNKEVRQTEIGHLFEHILLEYLCILKLDAGYNEACYDGVTDWNWRKDPVGTFYITVNAGYNDVDIFGDALKKTIDLTQQILNEQAFYQETKKTNFQPFFQK